MCEKDSKSDPKELFYENWESVSLFIYKDKNLSKENEEEVNALALLLYNNKKDKLVKEAISKNKHIKTFLDKRTKWTTRLKQISNQNPNTRLAVRGISHLLLLDPKKVEYSDVE